MFTKNINFSNFKFKPSLTKKKKLLKKTNSKKLILEFPLLKSLTKEYQMGYDKSLIKSLKGYKKINIIGMGGSILGTQAIYDFLKHKIKKSLTFFNNLQAKKFTYSNEKKINVLVSKSGNTIETISNFNILKQKQIKNKNIFITEKKISFLNTLANKLKVEVIDHKNFIGGRYSVLSEVGMLPAELMGLNEQKFKNFNQLIKNKNFVNSLIENVLAINHFVSKKKTNSIILNYDEKSDSFFRWYQQLTAESLGKKGKGILPFISTMPKDNHSLLQFYLDGPKNNFFTFFSVSEKNSSKINNLYLAGKYSNLKNKTLYKILMSQKKATENVFNRKRIPFRSFKVINRSEETMGELFSFFILETILLGQLMGVNSFDQPSVELVKKETARILG